MTSIEIAGLTGKRHDHVIRDIRKMAAELGDTFPQVWGKVASEGGRPLDVAYLPQRETLILVSGYSIEMRSRIIDRWRELEAAVASNAPSAVSVADLDTEVRKVIGGIVKRVVHAEIEGAISASLPALIEERLLADPRRAALDLVSVRQLLDDAKALPKGRNKVNRKIGRGLMGEAVLMGARGEPSPARKCPHTGVWLYKRDFADDFMRRRGLAFVADHNAAATGQSVIPFPKDRTGTASRPSSSADGPS